VASLSFENYFNLGGSVKLTPIQETLVKEAFTFVVDAIDEEGSLPSSSRTRRI
jgi:hypothetical protein